MRTTELRAEVHGASMRSLDSGERPPLLLIHGFPLDRDLWSPQLGAFGQERRVLAPDLIGSGMSAPEGRATVEAHADDLAALLDSLGVARAVVCGLSMGGYVALAMWRRHAARLAGLVLACTRAEADSDEAREGRFATAARVEAEGLRFLATAMPDKLLSKGASAHLREEVGAMIARQPATGTIAALEAMAARPDSRPDLPGITAPTLVITGADDALIPSDASRTMAAAIPSSQLVLVPGAGHLANLEEPGAFNAALRAFLERVDAGRAGLG